jgi:hypothetical protein
VNFDLQEFYSILKSTKSICPSVVLFFVCWLDYLLTGAHGHRLLLLIDHFSQEGREAGQFSQKLQ